jgi:tRNA threonylcarbamoyl adenosine modification protein YjeE
VPPVSAARPPAFSPPAAREPAPAVTTARAATDSAGDPRAVASRLAPLLQAGDVILLGGNLGAGKTTFVQGLAAALGVGEVVTSPTFTLVRRYPTAAGWDLLHADVYRLEQLQEVIDLALPEEVEDEACAVIEWGERAAPALAPEYLSITFDYAAGADQRVLVFEVVGESWLSRAARVAAAVGEPPQGHERGDMRS